MRNLHVTIWQVNTNAMQYLDLHSRLAYLYRTVDQAYAYLRDRSANKHRVRGIFVIPEYYFAAQSAAGHHLSSENRYLNADEADDIHSSLNCLSQLYPGLLIIPGTIMWKKPISEPTPIEKKPVVIQSDLYDLYASYDDGTRQLLQRTLGDLFGTDTHEALQRCDSVESIETVDCHSIYVYLNGKRVYQRDKQYDLSYDETLSRSLNASPIFEIDGIRFGIETFMDHIYGTLKTPVDVHIILSNCVRHQEGKGQYLIYVSHLANESGAWKAKDGKYHKLHCHIANDILDYNMQTA